MYNYSTDAGSTWLTTPVTLASNVACPSPGPLPVIAAGVPANSFELMVVYRTSTGLTSARTTTSAPAAGNWTTYAVANTNSNSLNQTLAATASFPFFRLAWNESNAIKKEDFYGSSWSSYSDISNGAYLVSDKSYPSYAISGNGDRGVAFEGTYQSHRAIVTNRNASTSVWGVIYNSSYDFSRVSLTGNDAGYFTAVFKDNQNNIKKQRFNDDGSYSPYQIEQANAADPSATINNPPGGTSYFIYRNSGSAPYTISRSTNSYSKSIDGAGFERVLNLFTDNQTSGVAMRIADISVKSYFGDVIGLDLQPVPDDGSGLSTDHSRYFRTASFTLMSDFDSIFAGVSARTENAGPLGDNLAVSIDLLSAGTGVLGRGDFCIRRPCLGTILLVSQSTIR